VKGVLSVVELQLRYDNGFILILEMFLSLTATPAAVAPACAAMSPDGY
jgi:hypothetical protein